MTENQEGLAKSENIAEIAYCRNARFFPRNRS
jgi:hypothetical protein